ncbi:sensor histidine kinase [Riemerella columbina]|uniref:sensor histidine kinase n=1 Tax=Riemerella columbina TaxID=103810 RepID=UPI00267087F6|nr:ATP-binding protein [Riemerella columbina]WKS95851.1 ATP-binding protein [Riemerella columbina]
MKPNTLSLLAAFFLTLTMVGVVFLFEYLNTYRWTMEKRYMMALALLVMFLLNYGVVNYLFQSYGRKKIKQMSHILPDEIATQGEEMNFKELSERISGLNEKATTEIDMMKAMEQYRKEYIGNVSHELKTPLFSIQSYVETLIDGGVEDLNIRDKYLQRVNQSIERLLNIVLDLDMINRLEMGEITLNYTVFEINAVIREVFDLLDIEAEKKEAKLILKNTAPTMVLADKQKILQVLINLISNAIYYANRDEAKIEVSVNGEGQKVMIEVKDNGMGIKPEVLPRIFERFYRVESSRNRRAGGSGLGLAIVKHILEAHGQNIEVQSRYLSGTRFIFSLDRA